MNTSWDDMISLKWLKLLGLFGCTSEQGGSIGLNKPSPSGPGVLTHVKITLKIRFLWNKFLTPPIIIRELDIPSVPIID